MKNRTFEYDEIKNIEENYRFKIIDQRPFEEGNTADTITKIETDSGKQFVVKMYEICFTPELIEFHARISDYLNNDGIPAPKVYQNKDKKFATPFNNKYYIVMDFLSGEHPKKDLRNIHEIIFPTLAKVHKSLSKFNPKKIYQQEIFTNPLSEQLKLFQSLLPHQPKNSIDEYILSYQKKLSELVNSIEEKVISLNYQPQMVMGDFNLETLLVSNEKVTGVLDFDFVHKNRRMFDVIHTIDLFCIDKEKENIPLLERVDWNKTQKCMNSYFLEDNTIYEEIEFAPLMLQLKGITDVIRVWKKGYNPESSIKEKEYFNRRVKFFVNRLEIATQYPELIIQNLKKGCKSN